MSEPDEIRDPRIAVHRFSDRISGRPADDVLRPGLTKSLIDKLSTWIDGFRGTGLRDLKTRAYHRLDLTAGYPFEDLQPMRCLDVVDQMLCLIVPTMGQYNESHQKDEMWGLIGSHLDRLNQVLADARSLYTVDFGEEQICLITRVDPATGDIVKELTDSSGVAGKHLHRSWVALYQLEPDSGLAYKEAVKAVEAALGPVILPKNTAPTLGLIKAAVRDGGWQFALGRTGPSGKPPSIAESANSSVTFLVDLLERLAGTEARHGLSGEDRRQTAEQAASAVYSAVAILGWVKGKTFTKE